MVFMVNIVDLSKRNEERVEKYDRLVGITRDEGYSVSEIEWPFMFSVRGHRIYVAIPEREYEGHYRVTVTGEEDSDLGLRLAEIYENEMEMNFYFVYEPRKGVDPGPRLELVEGGVHGEDEIVEPIRFFPEEG